MNTKKGLITVFAVACLALLSGCASTFVKDGSIQSRTVKFSVLNVITYEKTTEGLVVGEIDLLKEIADE